MSNNIEIEAKVLLSKEDYEKILQALEVAPSKIFVQVNHYIDSPEKILRNNGIALRIRERDDSYDLTLKTPLSEGLLEKNQKISKEEYDAMSNNKVFPEGSIKEFLAILGLPANNLEILASLKTERYEGPFHAGKLALDKNSYCGIVDYELELEHSSMLHAEELIISFLNGLKIPCSFNHMSKQARAINYSDKK